MGNGGSKEEATSDAKEEGSSRLSRVKQRIRHHRPGHPRRHGNVSSASSLNPKLHSADDFAGVALLTLIRAEMKFKDKWLACVTLGEQTFRSEISDHTDSPVWKSEKKLLLEKAGPHVARISVFETNRLSRNNIIGYCEIDLLEFITRHLKRSIGLESAKKRHTTLARTAFRRIYDSCSLKFFQFCGWRSYRDQCSQLCLSEKLDADSEIEEYDLLDPSSSDTVVGKISLSCSVEDPVETEKRFARSILSIVDYNEDGKLSFSEFSDLINAFGNQLAAAKKEELFKVADKNHDGVVSMDELAALLAIQQEKEPLMNCCPVCGESFGGSNKLNAMVHLALCFDEGTGNQVMTGGFLTEKQASYGWMFKLSEWAHVSSYDIGLRSGSSASHILVFDRKTKRLVEELIDGKIVLSMRAIYQSKLGLGLINAGAKELLQMISEKQGKKMNSAESAKDIPKFLEFFKDQINRAEVKHPVEYFKTFNEFFIRELKPGARPIACAGRDDVAVCAADSRLMAFKSADDSLRFWIKGRKFSIQGLLGPDVSSGSFIDGALVIFRLAPQDYHRFHFPVSGTVEQFVNIPGCLYTVNPIAVNSKYCNVFTENKRVVSVISTTDFGKVAFVAIGATMVGSITFSKKEGDHVKKGDEFGYFSFGGSTVICVFEKDAIEIDEDLLSNSARPLETLVSVGMQLGVSKKRLSKSVLPNLQSCNLGE